MIVGANGSFVVVCRPLKEFLHSRRDLDRFGCISFRAESSAFWVDAIRCLNCLMNSRSERSPWPAAIEAAVTTDEAFDGDLASQL